MWFLDKAAHAVHPQLVHCSYHKCLTLYFRKVADAVFNRVLFAGRGYRHFNSRLDAFLAEARTLRLASLNNHVVDTSQLADYRITRFVRDPRDLVVSGYFYHRRDPERWTGVESPSDGDWGAVNGHVPDAVGQRSYAAYLNAVSVEDGLIAEIDFRTFHFQSMRSWPDDDPHIRVYRYEDVLGRESTVFRDMFDFYGLSLLHRQLASTLADRFSASRQRRRSGHIRDPDPHQWRAHFTPRVARYFDERHADLLDRHGYE